MNDSPVLLAQDLVAQALATDARPVVRTFFDPETYTATHVVHDPASRRAAIIDPVLDFDPASGRTASHNADAVIAYVQGERLTVDWLLETHAHADHLSAAPCLKEALGGEIVIGQGIVGVQRVFVDILGEAAHVACDGSQFDRLVDDGDQFALGKIPAMALHVPGHTPACIAYVIGDAVFVGDTLFMPDYGTARADFPGGDARMLFRSIRRLMALPDATRVFVCHDYLAPERTDYAWETTIGEERRANVHVHEGVSEVDFAVMREARDKTLSMPRLILPALQVNIRGGRLPEPEANGVRYLKLPLNAF